VLWSIHEIKQSLRKIGAIPFKECRSVKNTNPFGISVNALKVLLLSLGPWICGFAVLGSKAGNKPLKQPLSTQAWVITYTAMNGPQYYRTHIDQGSVSCFESSLMDCPGILNNRSWYPLCESCKKPSIRKSPKPPGYVTYFGLRRSLRQLRTNLYYKACWE